MRRKKLNEQVAVMVAGLEAFKTYNANPPDRTNPILKAVLKFLLAKTKSSDTISTFSNQKKMEERIELVDNWRSYFDQPATSDPPTQEVSPNTKVDAEMVVLDEDNLIGL